MTSVSETCSSQEVCDLGVVDFLLSLQEVVVLGLAFALGWLLFRPMLSLILGIPVRRAVSKSENRIHIGLSKLKLSSESQPEDLSLTKADVESSPEGGSLSKSARERSVPSMLSFNEDFGPGEMPGKSGVCSHCLENDWQQECCDEMVEEESIPGRFDAHGVLDVPGQLAHLALARERARRQDIKGSDNCIEAVRCAGGQVDQRTLRIFTTACAQVGKVDKAVSCFQKAMAEGSGPGFRSFVALIRALCSQGCVHQALEFFDLMLQRGHRPDASLVDALLECCISQAQLDLAERVTSVMDAYHLRPSNTTLAASMRLCFARGELAQALAVFQEMPKNYGFVPNAYVHGILISMCHCFGKSESALQVYESMLSCGCRPDARTYECLVRCCFGIGRFLQAVSLVDEALGLQELEGRTQTTRRIFIDCCVVEDLLGALGRRGLARAVAMPLLDRLQAGRFEIADDISAAVVRAAEAEAQGPKKESMTKRRRMEFQHWRDLRRADLVVAAR